uniref:Uncharacterized protein n=1 Tax=Arundo donax TaxID=35708 RepID=A0A0A9H169_ARUDO
MRACMPACTHVTWSTRCSRCTHACIGWPKLYRTIDRAVSAGCCQ